MPTPPVLTAVLGVQSLLLLALLSPVFITTNLSIGYTFSSIAQNQLQANMGMLQEYLGV